jgi:hypothetical protein
LKNSMWEPFLTLPMVKPLVFAGLLYLAGLSYRKALEVLAEGIPPAQVIQRAEAGGFALYLRSFQDDALKIDMGSSGWRRLLLISPFAWVYHRVFMLVRLEEMITRALWPYRPVLSVAPTGNIRAVMPSLTEYGVSTRVGSLQLNLSNETWQDEMTRLVRKASSVVMVAAATRGLRWEYEQLTLSPDLRSKTVLLVPRWIPSETAEVLSLSEGSWNIEDDPVARWCALTGGASSLEKIPEGTLLRTVAITFNAEGRATLLTADRHSAEAYRLALHLAQLPRQQLGFTANASTTDRKLLSSGKR